jgi:hypothetical protein
MDVTKPATLDLLDTKSPALSSTSDMPVVETKPDATAKVDPPKKEVDATAAPDKGKTDTEESATSPESASASEPQKPARGVQKRLDELTKQREDALRNAESERQEKLRLLALLESKGKPESEPKVQDDTEPVRPQKAEFADPDAYDEALDEYIDARSAWRADKAINEAREKDRKDAEQRQIEEGQRAASEAYAQRREKAREKYSDYTEVAESPQVNVSIPVAHAILHSEHGPDIAYHLGKNPAEAERISKLPPPLQLVELGLIVARLQGPATSVQVDAATVQASPPVKSQAPKPGKPLASGSDNSTKNIEEMSVEEYAEVYRNRPENKRRPGMRQ